MTEKFPSPPVLPDVAAPEELPAATRPAALELRGVSKQYPGVRALDEVSFAIAAGGVHAICGENGAGKSTLLSILGGIIPHGSFDGEVLLDGDTYEVKGVRGAESNGVVVIHQELALCGNLTVTENIFLGNELTAWNGLIDEETAYRRTRELLASVGLDARPDDLVATLGIGQQQLVEIAKALSKEVRVLILDEPTSALNDEDSAHLLGLVAKLRETGITCIIVSHKLNEIEAIADAVTVIRDGRVIESMPREDISEERIIRGMVGRSLEHRFPPRTASVGAESFRIEGWTLASTTRARNVADDVTIDVKAGEIVGLCGLVGSGRTELALSVFGRSYGGRPSAGRVYIDGREVQTRSVPEAIRAGLAYVTEDRKQLGLDLGADVRTNLTLVALRRMLRGGLIAEDREVRTAKKLVSNLGVRTASINTPVGTLSGGNQQKVLLGKWIVSEPRVLILDEPTRGVDVGAKYEIYSVINELASRGAAILLISSELPELIGMADRIFALNEGRITGSVNNPGATQEELMRLMTMETKK